MAEKYTFLCAHDYGMGGVWMTISARSADEIEEKYPDLTVVDDRPDWMTYDVYEEIVKTSSYDIDSPTGWLFSFTYAKQRESEGKRPFMFRGVKGGVTEYRTIWARDVSEINSQYSGLEDLTGVPLSADDLDDMGTSDIDEPDEFLVRYRR